MRGTVGTSAMFLHSLLPYGREGHWVNRKKERRGWGMACAMHGIAGSCLLQGNQARYRCRQEAQVSQTADGWSQ